MLLQKPNLSQYFTKVVHEKHKTGLFCAVSVALSPYNEGWAWDSEAFWKPILSADSVFDRKFPLLIAQKDSIRWTLQKFAQQGFTESGYVIEDTFFPWEKGGAIRYSSYSLHSYFRTAATNFEFKRFDDLLQTLG